jgi:FkbM family methyltransferase
MNSKVANFLARNRRTKWVSRLNRMVVSVHRACENLNYDFFTNGEAAVMKRLEALQVLKTIFDVGANEGAWSKLASAYAPEAYIHSFEIVPDTFAQLVANCAGSGNVQVHHLGLSDEDGRAIVYYSPSNSRLATCVAGFLERFHHYESEGIVVSVATGDRFCSEKCIDSIDFLKIDVEGSEPRVLRGFQRMLGKGRINVIQFEYGFTNVEVRFLLKDFYDFFSSYHMKVGKIYPNHVDFREYSYADENFYGPNYLAVHSSREDIISALQVI